MKTGVQLIAVERQRQVKVEVWTAHHDDSEHINEELACAAVCYALPFHWRQVTVGRHGHDYLRHALWPWDSEWWKPSGINSTAGRIRELVKAGALIAAEIDRLQRSQQGASP